MSFGYSSPPIGLYIKINNLEKIILKLLNGEPLDANDEKIISNIREKKGAK